AQPSTTRFACGLDVAPQCPDDQRGDAVHQLPWFHAERVRREEVDLVALRLRLQADSAVAVDTDPPATGLHQPGREDQRADTGGQLPLDALLLAIVGQQLVLDEARVDSVGCTTVTVEGPDGPGDATDRGEGMEVVPSPLPVHDL